MKCEICGKNHLAIGMGYHSAKEVLDYIMGEDKK